MPGVAPTTASSFSASIRRGKTRLHNMHGDIDRQAALNSAVTGKGPSFTELCGQGWIVEASKYRRNLHIKGLSALGVRTTEPDGSCWDFNRAEDRQLAVHLVDRDKPTWIIGSPPCLAYSRINASLNYAKMAPEKVQQMLGEGRRHLHFVLSLYKRQLDGGRRFLHEHPESATSWSARWVLNKRAGEG